MSTKAEITTGDQSVTTDFFQAEVNRSKQYSEHTHAGGMELQNIKLLDKEDGEIFHVPEEKACIRKEEIQSSRGNFQVTLHGTEGKPAILTFHDIGQNHVSAFQSFLNCREMTPILHSFTIYHIDAPGQHEGAAKLPETYVYPTMDELAEMVADVVGHFKLKSFVGLGIGAGANILCRYGLKYPKIVDGLVLLNCFSGKSGWVEWGYEKVEYFINEYTDMNTQRCDK